MTIRFFVPGTPVGQPRPRARAFMVGKVARVQMYDPGTAGAWRAAIEQIARQHAPAHPLSGPVRADLLFLFPRPARLTRKSSPRERIPHITKPDRDNLEKAALDAMTNAGIWSDDKQVFGGFVVKLYAAMDEQPGMFVEITQPPEAR